MHPMAEGADYSPEATSCMSIILEEDKYNFALEKLKKHFLGDDFRPQPILPIIDGMSDRQQSEAQHQATKDTVNSWLDSAIRLENEKPVRFIVGDKGNNPNKVKIDIDIDEEFEQWKNPSNGNSVNGGSPTASSKVSSPGSNSEKSSGLSKKGAGLRGNGTGPRPTEPADSLASMLRRTQGTRSNAVRNGGGGRRKFANRIIDEQRHSKFTGGRTV